MNVVIDVLHDGINKNKSSFSKEVVDENIDSIKNTPVLGFIKCENDSMDFCGHESIITKTDDGIEEKYIGQAYGVIPESCNPRWETKIDSDGVEREHLLVDALLWSKFEDSVSILERDGEKSQSMELEVSSIDGYKEDGIFYFTKFRFDGCCILGDNVSPAMNGANVVVSESQNTFSMDKFMQAIQKEMKDKCSAFYSILENKEKKDVKEPTMSKDKYTQTLMSQWDDIKNIVKDYEVYETEYGYKCCRYNAVDIQDDEVIVYDAKDHWNYYGMKFTVKNDKPVIDFASATRKKVCYENYDENGGSPVLDGAFNFSDEIDGICKEMKEKIDAANTEKQEAVSNFSKVQEDYNELKAKYDVLVEKETKREQAEINAAKDSVFAKYEVALNGIDAYSELKGKKDSMSVKDIESECAIMFAEKTLNAKLDTNNSGKFSAQILDDESGNDDSGFEYEKTKYGNIPVNRK